MLLFLSASFPGRQPAPGDAGQAAWLHEGRDRRTGSAKETLLPMSRTDRTGPRPSLPLPPCIPKNCPRCPCPGRCYRAFPQLLRPLPA